MDSTADGSCDGDEKVPSARTSLFPSYCFSIEMLFETANLNYDNTMVLSLLYTRGFVWDFVFIYLCLCLFGAQQPIVWK